MEINPQQSIKIELLHYFRAFITTHMITATTIKISIKAHHIPALKMPDITLQPGKILRAKAIRKNKGVFFIMLNLKSLIKISCHNYSPARCFEIEKKNKMPAKTTPLKKEAEVQQNPDPHIDQDFPGFPHLPADKKSITPKTPTEKKSAGTTKKKSKKTYGG